MKKSTVRTGKRPKKLRLPRARLILSYNHRHIPEGYRSSPSSEEEEISVYPPRRHGAVVELSSSSALSMAGMSLQPINSIYWPFLSLSSTVFDSDFSLLMSELLL